VISEDASTDGTAAVIREYAEKHPKLIRYFENKKNWGVNRNFMQAISCRGKYVAIVDGDDYWTYPNKLQTQVDFLENHPECSFCGTATKVFYQAREEYVPGHPELPEDDGVVHYFDVADLYELWLFWIPTHSLMVRNEYVELPHWFPEAAYVDRALRLILAFKGKDAYQQDDVCLSQTRYESNQSTTLCFGSSICGFI